MIPFITGQRWISESEPELGLGTVVQAENGRVQVLFSATGEKRTYASDNAPLKRVRFRAGDTVKAQEGSEFTIKEVIEKEGLLVYLGDNQELSETRLSDALSVHGPEDRLFAARFDESAKFELRLRTLTLLHRSRKSSVRGFVGGRIDLIPHQLYIAQEVAGRHAPRVMLSDEVGLGKTIEACLILHRLLLSGRADRILVLVPETLMHQWFVEMLRRFNVWVNIFDEERCAAIETGEPDANPFLDDQLVLTSIDFLAGSERRSAQASAAGWDVLVVDEAHHLEWSPEAPSREYLMVEELSRQSKGLLLLTATPEQLGIESHFARLRLLDPDRYRDLATFQAESKDYQSTADAAEKLLTEKKLDLLEDLLDMHGPGRVLFRNTRNAMPGFPKRFARLARLDVPTGPRAVPGSQQPQTRHGPQISPGLPPPPPGDLSAQQEGAPERTTPPRARPAETMALTHATERTTPQTEDWLDRAATEFAMDAGDKNLQASFELTQDPRILWLVELLQKLDPKKVLLICRSIEKVEAIDAALRRHLNIKTGIFHEGLTLVQRDRAAAWFGEADGARLLICSEIGSEGRNFQFAHHLVLFDLPLNPELLEQRIGRLDRIGQTEDIQIHVPYLAHSPQEVLVRWYHEGLTAFETNLEGGNELLRMFGRAVHDLALEFSVAERSAAEKELTELLKKTTAARLEMRQRLEQGRDRLLEMNSFRPAVAQKIIAEIQREDQEPELENFLLDVFDHFGVHIEELALHTWQLNPQGIITDSFPAMPAEGMVATCDRQRAVHRDDVGFLTWDHPLVTGAMDLLLGSETGNCAFGVLPSAGERTLLLELIFVLEPIAAPRLHVDRFLPATPIRVLINHKLEGVGRLHPSAMFEGKLQKGSPYKLIENADLSRRTIPGMLKRASTLAETQAATLRQTAQDEMVNLLGHEVSRLKTLMLVNDHIRPEELKLAEEQQEQLASAIRQSRLRLDSLRLIWKGPPEALR